MTTVQERQALSVNLPARPLTLDDVAKLADADDVHRYELDGGRLIVMPPPTNDHQELISAFTFWFMLHGRGPKHVLGAVGVRTVYGANGRCPDLVVLRESAPRGTVWIDPALVLLAIEVVSPSSKTDDRLAKPAEYAAAGIPHFWRVDNDAAGATVHQFRRGEGDPTYHLGQVVSMEKLLAGEPPQLG